MDICNPMVMQAYNTITKELSTARANCIIQVGCWAHVRRRFIEAKGGKDFSSHADVALAKIAALFHIDIELRKASFSENDFVAKRKANSAPVLDELFIWLQGLSPQVLPKTYLGMALSYTMKEWPKLINYLEHAYLTPDNNIAENAQRPFVIGRKIGFSLTRH